jgi:hypothetical protein
LGSEQNSKSTFRNLVDGSDPSLRFGISEKASSVSSVPPC